jgi:hypothetical protein
VATEEYAALQDRLVGSLRRVGYSGGLLTWTGAFPPGSPTHREVPYAFKPYALGQALREGYTSVLWLDAPCLALGALDPLFEHIEREGHALVSGDEWLGNWASDPCLSEYALSRDQAMTVPLIFGSFIGLDLRNSRSRDWFMGWWEASRRGLFNGPSLSPHAPERVRARMPGKSLGPLSGDPRCWGHRHDEAVGSCLAYRLGLAVEARGRLVERLLRLEPAEGTSDTR